jgi:hypothetical protein
MYQLTLNSTLGSLLVVSNYFSVLKLESVNRDATLTFNLILQAFTQRLHSDSKRSTIRKVSEPRIDPEQRRRPGDDLLQPGHRAVVFELQQSGLRVKDETFSAAGHERRQHVHSVALRQPRLLSLPRTGFARSKVGTFQLRLRPCQFVLFVASQRWIRP